MVSSESHGLLLASAKQKAATRHIVISEPDEQQLQTGLEGRELAPELLSFLKRLIKASRWMRKINVPSCRNDLAAVIVFTSALKESGLEIFSELHVFLAGKVITEKWQIAGEKEQKSKLSQRAFTSVDIQKVRVEGDVVNVEIGGPTSAGIRQTRIRSFDFSDADMSQLLRVVPHPLLL